MSDDEEMCEICGDEFDNRAEMAAHMQSDHPAEAVAVAAAAASGENDVEKDARFLLCVAVLDSEPALHAYCRHYPEFIYHFSHSENVLVTDCMLLFSLISLLAPPPPPHLWK